MPAIETRDGTRIAYETFGEGRPLVLIPGLGASSRAWGGFPRALGDHCRAIAFDPRGFAGSPAPPSSITLDTMVSDLLDLLDSLSIPSADLFGVSMGGILARRFASLHGERTSRLILVSTPGRMTPWARHMLVLFEIMARRLSPREYVRMMSAMSLSPDSLDQNPRIAEDLESGLLPQEGEMDCILAQLRSLQSLPRPSGRGAGTRDVEPLPHRTLILAGRRDFLTPPTGVSDLRALFPNSEAVYLSGGHAALMENSQEGVVEILRFLRAGGTGA